MRITDNDLRRAESNLNEFLKSIKVRVGHRYGYIALDLTDPEGKILDTLISGLTKREAFNILTSIKEVFHQESWRASETFKVFHQEILRKEEA